MRDSNRQELYERVLMLQHHLWCRPGVISTVQYSIISYVRLRIITVINVFVIRLLIVLALCLKCKQTLF